MTWDTYFHNICNAVGSKSNCLSRKIGSILVKDKSIIASGYNGPSRGIPHCDSLERREAIISAFGIKDPFTINELKQKLNKCPRQVLGYKSGEGLEICIAAHSERNCIIDAARRGVNVYGSTLYLNTGIPCKDCLVEIINSGMQEIVCEKKFSYDKMTNFLLEHSDITVREFELES